MDGWMDMSDMITVPGPEPGGGGGRRRTKRIASPRQSLGAFSMRRRCVLSSIYIAAVFTIA